MADLAKLVVRLDAQTAAFTSGLNQATARIGQFEKNVTASASRIDRTLNAIPKALAGVLAGVTSGAALRSVLAQADAYKTLQGRLRLVTSSEEELARVSQSLFEVAQRTRQPLADTAELYTRVAQNAKDLGLTQQQLLGFTETVSKAFQVSGASTVEAAGAIRQLSQALASGVFRGEEFNSVAEQGPRILQALTDSLGVTRGELRKMAEQGKLTPDIVIKGLEQASAAISAEFEALPATLAQSLTQVRNELFKTFGQVDTSDLSAAIGEVRGSLEKPVGSNALVSALDELTEALATTIRLGNQFSGEILTAAFAGLAVAAGRYGSALAATAVAQAAAIYEGQQQLAVNVANAKAFQSLTVAQAAETAATLESTQATLATIVAAREEELTKLQVAHANALAAKSSLELAAANAASVGASERATAAFYNYAKAEEVAALAAQKLVLIEERRIVVEAELAAATNASAAAQTRAAAAANGTAAAVAATGIAARASAAGLTVLRTALAFVGGPVGAAIVAAAGLAYFISKMESAEEKSQRLSRRLKELRGDFQALANEDTNKELEGTQKAIAEVDAQITRLQAKLQESAKSGGRGLLGDAIDAKRAEKLNQLAKQRVLLLQTEFELQKKLEAVPEAKSDAPDAPDAPKTVASSKGELDNARRLAKAIAEAEAAEAKAGLAHQQSLLDIALDQKTKSYKDYFAEKLKLDQAAIDAEVTQRRKELAALGQQQAAITAQLQDQKLDPDKRTGLLGSQADLEEERVRLLSEISQFNIQRQTLKDEADANLLKSEKELQDQIVALQARALEAAGSSLAAQKLLIEQEFADLIASLNAQGKGDEVEIAIRLKGLALARAEFEDLAKQIERVQGEYARRQQEIDLATQTGTMSIIDARKAQQEAAGKAAAAEKVLYDQMLAIAEQTKIPELTEKVRQLKGEIEATANISLGPLTKEFSVGMKDALQQYSDSIKNVGDTFGGDLVSAIDRATTSTADLLAQTLLYGKGGKDAAEEIARTLITDLVSSLIKVGIQMAVNFALSRALGAAAVSSTVGMAGAAAAAWAPAAIAASTATLGGATATGLAAYLASLGTAQAATLAASAAGFKSGGYTGDGPVDEVAGVVHRRETVLNADATSAAVKAINDPNFWSHAAMPESDGPQVVIQQMAPGVDVKAFGGGLFRVEMIPELLELIDTDQAQRATDKRGRAFAATARSLNAQPRAVR